MAGSADIFPRERTTRLPGGYMGKILRVDLTTGSTKEENLPEEPLLRKYIGGQALALYILLRELPLNATPYGPESKVVMMTGPLIGTGLTPGGTKVTAVYLSPLTNYSLGRGASSGFWAVYLKAAGFDGIIIEDWPWSNVVAEQYRQFIGLMGGCWFAQMHMKPDGLNSIVDSFNATTGWDFNLDEALVAGHRSAILQSIFATQRGWVAEHDWQNVGPRFLEPVPDGKYQGFTIAKWLPAMVNEYYRLSGRHEKTGRPFMDTLSQLGLEEFKEWSHLD